MNDNDRALLRAARRGDIPAIKQLLATGAHIEAVGDFGCTALLLAASKGNFNTVLFLLKSGANRYHCNMHGDDALSLALLWGGNQALVEEIFRSGLNFYTSLHRAAYEGDVDSVRHCLTEIGADTEDKGKHTALHYAAAWGHLAVLDVLKSKGCCMDRVGNNGYTALLWAVHNGRTNAVEWLLDHGASLTEKDSYGRTALLLASGNGHNAMVEWLLSHGASQAEKDNNGDTALLLAAYNGHTATVEWLLNHGASLIERNNRGNTALLLAASNGQTATVRWLLDYGASLAEKDDNGSNALLWAARNGHAFTVEWLLDNYDVSLIEKDKEGMTALSLAAINGHTTTVKYLLNHRASLAQSGDGGFIAIIWAAMNGHTATVECLVNHDISLSKKVGPDGVSALLAAAGGGHTATVKCLLNRGASLAQRDKYGHTALLWAAREGHTTTVEWLLNYGASLAEKDNYGNTALLSAALNGQTATVEWLLKHGASLAEKNNGGNTPLLLAVREGHTATVEWLLNHGVSLTEKDKYGYTALLFAAGGGHTVTVKYLLDHGASLAEKNKYDHSALTIAAAFGHNETVSSLLDYDVSLAVANQQARVLDKGSLTTALMEARKGRYPEVVRQLEAALECDQYYANALSRISENHGKNTIEALQLLQRSSDGWHVKAYTLLVCAKALRASLLQAAEARDWQTLAVQLSALVDEESLLSGYSEKERCLFVWTIMHEASGNTLLHIAAEQGDEPTACLLLSHGINTCALNKAQRAPFELAKTKGHDRLAYLIEHYPTFYRYFPGVAPILIHPNSNSSEEMMLPHFPLDNATRVGEILSYVMVLAPHCKGLVFVDSIASKEGLAELFQQLRQQNYGLQLQKLGFERCGITDELLKELLIALPDFSSLRVLRLEGNQLLHHSNKNLQLLIERCPRLEELDLTENKLDKTVPFLEWMKVAERKGHEFRLQLRGNHIKDVLINSLHKGSAEYLKTDLSGNPILGYKRISTVQQDKKHKRDQMKMDFKAKKENYHLFFTPDYSPLSVFRLLAQANKPYRVSSKEWHVALCATKKGLFGHAFLLIEGVFKSGQYFLFRGELVVREGNNAVVKYGYVEDKRHLEADLDEEKYHVRLFHSRPKELLNPLKKEIETLGTNEETMSYGKWATASSNRPEGGAQRAHNCATWCVACLKSWHIPTPEEERDLGNWLTQILPGEVAGRKRENCLIS